MAIDNIPKIIKIYMIKNKNGKLAADMKNKKNSKIIY